MCEEHQPRAKVTRVRAALDVAHLLELLDGLGHRLPDHVRRDSAPRRAQPLVLAAGIFLASDGHHWSELFVQWGIAAVIVIGALVGSAAGVPLEPSLPATELSAASPGGRRAW
jgi:hypothetical protein